jgi:hypothetical protein
MIRRSKEIKKEKEKEKKKKDGKKHARVPYS